MENIEKPSRLPLKDPFKTIRILLLLCFAMWIAFSLRKNTDYDIGFHLKGGKGILQEHSIPRVDTYTYTVPGHSYIDMQWLYQAALYGLYRLAGYGTLTLFNCLLVALLFFILLKRLRLFSPEGFGSPFFLTLLILGIEHRLLLRPEVLSWVFLALTLWILDMRYWNKGNYLKFLPLIQLVWANVEGLFALGWIVMAAYGLGSWLRDKRMDRPLMKWSAGSVLATAVNPYFLKGTLFPFVLQTRLQGSNIFKQSIGELLSPWADAIHNIYPVTPVFLLLYKALFVLSFLIALVCLKKTRIHEWILLAAFGLLSATALRNIPLFFLVAVPILARLIPEVKGMRWARLAAQGCLMVFLAVNLVRIPHNAYYLANGNRTEFGLGLSEGNLPLKVSQFMVDHRLNDRLVNSSDFGGWLEWQGFQTYIDGRLEVIGEGLYGEYLDTLKGKGLMDLVEKAGAPIVVYDHRSLPLWTMQLMEAKWRLIYLDENAAVYAKPGYRLDLPDADPGGSPLRWGLGPLSKEQVEGLLRMPPVSWFRVLIEGLAHPQVHYQKYLYLGNLAFHYQHYDAAQRMYLEGLRLAQGREYDFYPALARSYIRTQQWRYARWCLESALLFTREVPRLQAELASIPFE